jgi:hypothetical protein
MLSMAGRMTSVVGPVPAPIGRGSGVDTYTVGLLGKFKYVVTSSS